MSAEGATGLSTVHQTSTLICAHYQTGDATLHLQDTYADLVALSREGVITGVDLHSFCGQNGHAGCTCSGRFVQTILKVDNAALRRYGNVYYLKEALSRVALYSLPQSLCGWLDHFTAYLEAARGLDLLEWQQVVILRAFVALPAPSRALLSGMMLSQLVGTGYADHNVYKSPLPAGMDDKPAQDALYALLSPLLAQGWLTPPSAGDGSTPALRATLTHDGTLLIQGHHRLTVAEGFRQTAKDVAVLVLGCGFGKPLVDALRAMVLGVAGMARYPLAWGQTWAAPLASGASAPPAGATSAQSSNVRDGISQWRTQRDGPGPAPFVLFPHRVSFQQYRDAHRWARSIRVARLLCKRASDLAFAIHPALAVLSESLRATSQEGGSSGHDGESAASSSAGKGWARFAVRTGAVRTVLSQVLYRPPVQHGDGELDSSTFRSFGCTPLRAAFLWRQPPLLRDGLKAEVLLVVDDDDEDVADLARAPASGVGATSVGSSVQAVSTVAHMTGGSPYGDAQAAATAAADALLRPAGPRGAPNSDSLSRALRAPWCDRSPHGLHVLGTKELAAQQQRSHSASGKGALAGVTPHPYASTYWAPYGMPAMRLVPAPPSASPSASNLPLCVPAEVYALECVQAVTNPVSQLADGILDASSFFISHGKLLQGAASAGAAEAYGAGSDGSAYLRDFGIDATPLDMPLSDRGILERDFAPSPAAWAFSSSSSSAAAAAPRASRVADRVDVNPQAALLLAARLAYFVLQLPVQPQPLGDAVHRRGLFVSPLGSTGPALPPSTLVPGDGMGTLGPRPLAYLHACEALAALGAFDLARGFLREFLEQDTRMRCVFPPVGRFADELRRFEAGISKTEARKRQADRERDGDDDSDGGDASKQVAKRRRSDAVPFSPDRVRPGTDGRGAVVTDLLTLTLVCPAWPTVPLPPHLQSQRGGGGAAGKKARGAGAGTVPSVGARTVSSGYSVVADNSLELGMRGGVDRDALADAVDPRDEVAGGGGELLREEVAPIAEEGEEDGDEDGGRDAANVAADDDDDDDDVRIIEDDADRGDGQDAGAAGRSGPRTVAAASGALLPLGPAPSSSASSSAAAPRMRLRPLAPRTVSLRPGRSRKYFVGVDGEPCFVEHAVMQALTRSPRRAIEAWVRGGARHRYAATATEVRDQGPAPAETARLAPASAPARSPLAWWHRGGEWRSAVQQRAASGFRLVGTPHKLERLLHLQPGSLDPHPFAGDGNPVLPLAMSLACGNGAVLTLGHPALQRARFRSTLAGPLPTSHMLDKPTGFMTDRITYNPAVHSLQHVPSKDLPDPRPIPEGVTRLVPAHGCNGWRAVHGENLLWQTLYVLVFWDVIFATPASVKAQQERAAASAPTAAVAGTSARAGNAPAVGSAQQTIDASGNGILLEDRRRAEAAAEAYLPWMFKHPWKGAPLDFASEDFQEKHRRGGLIRARCEELRRITPCALAAQVLETYTRHYGCTAPRMRWETFALADLVELAHACGGQPLAVIGEQLAHSWTAKQAGFPDLCAWRPAPCLECDLGCAAVIAAAHPDPGGVGANGVRLPLDGSSAGFLADDNGCPIVVDYVLKRQGEDAATSTGLGASSPHQTSAGHDIGFQFYCFPVGSNPYTSPLVGKEHTSRVIQHRGRWFFTKGAAMQLKWELDTKRSTAMALKYSIPTLLLAEVKSENDHIHSTQHEWMRLLSEQAGVRVAVLNVVTPPQ